MSRVLVHPDSATTSLAPVLDLLGCEWKAADRLDELAALRPDDGWDLVIVAVDDDPERAFSVLREVRPDEGESQRVFVLVTAELLPELGDRTDLFDDFCLTPFHPAELEARLDHLLVRAGQVVDEAIISYGPLSLNVETYQAVIDGRALDLTYMEYELLRYLASRPGKVFSREILLSEVWGYDYYGGARTVDVHIRRLRSKLGEEHASLITTVRSVGYRFGTARWS